MDFWDVAKRMWRRWYLTVPLLLLTAASAGWVAATVGPDYQVTSHIAVLPPELQRNDNDSEVIRVNPWTVEALADAAAIRLMGKQLEEAIAAEGYKAEWTVEVTGLLPVLRIDVVAHRPEDARAVTARLLETVEAEVHEQQAEHNLQPGEEITTVRYDTGDSIETVTKKLKRALVAVAGVGIILTMAVVLAVDALARRKLAKIEAEASADARAAGTAEARPTVNVENGMHGPADQARRRYVFANQLEGDADAAGVPMAGSNGADRLPGDWPPAEPAPRGGGYGPIHMEVQVATRAPRPAQVAEERGRRDEPAEMEPSSAPDDATVVLPLSNLPRHRRDNGADSHGAGTL